MIQDVELSIGPWQTSTGRPIDQICVRFQSHLEPNTRAAIAGPFQDVRKVNMFSTGATLAATDLWTILEFWKYFVWVCSNPIHSKRVRKNQNWILYLYIMITFMPLTSQLSLGSPRGPVQRVHRRDLKIRWQPTSNQPWLGIKHASKIDLYHLKMLCLNAHVVEYTKKMGFVLQ